jgi:exopolysaccharide biosynthesis polyprenyl glycosylphosphotransferase
MATHFLSFHSPVGQHTGPRAGRTFSPILPAVDAVAVLASFAVFAASMNRGMRPWTLSYAVTTFLVLGVGGTQRTRLNPQLSNDLSRLLGQISVPLLAFQAAAVAGNASVRLIEELAKVAAVTATLVPGGRSLSYAAIRHSRVQGRRLEPTLIVGAGEVGAQMITILREHREFGLAPVGFVDSYQGTGLAMPILADVDTLGEVIEHHRVTNVIVAFGAMQEATMIDVLRACDALPVEVYVVPRFFELGVAPPGGCVEEIWGIPLVRLARSASRPVASLMKRAFDVLACVVGIIVALPLLLVIAVAISCSSPGPVLFRQVRIGKDGSPFDLLKFRTMTVNGDSDTTWSVVGDARLTAVGRVLRRTSLDELPQLLNVLRGDMSLVGPRPERPHFAALFSKEVGHYGDRLRVPGGMTGWAQVHGLRGDTPIPDRIRFDNSYIEHWSFWRDIVILVRTVSQVFRRGG